MKRILILAALAAASLTARAQQDILLSQYMFNQLLINPGYAGSKDYMMATLLYRDQWTGWDNAPTSQVASIHGPLGITQLGWGALIAHDHEGVTDRTDLYANASYHRKLNDKYKLGLGLRAGGSYWVRDNAKIRDVLKHHPVEWDENDPLFAGDNKSSFLPNAGAGLFLYSKYLYAGLSIPEVVSYDPDRALSITGTNVTPHQVRHYFFTAGYAIPVGQDIILKPSTLLKYTQNAPLEADINLNALFYNVLWIGGSYRTGDAALAMVEVILNKQWQIGYAYDFTLTDIKKYSSGSHEIMIGYNFGYDIQKMKTPRYF